jgi:hypothetical protein
MPRRATAAQPKTIDQQAELDPILMPPSTVAPEKKAAYWLEVIDNPAELRKAVATEEFFSLLRQFPAPLWSDNRLSLYLYRRPDDDGLMVNNAPDAKRKYAKVYHQPVDEEFISKHWGGGKYTLYLKLDNDETIKECTFLIDGPPKVQPGQTVIIDGKPTTVGAAPAPTIDAPRSDVASVIQASADANKQNMEILAEGSKAAIQLVRDQVSQSAKPEGKSELMEVLVPLLPALLERFLTPPPQVDVFAMLTQAKTLFAAPVVVDPPEPKDPPLKEALTLVEEFTGRSMADIMKGRSTPAAESTPSWVPIALGALDKLAAALPGIMQQATYAATVRFQRDAWLRTAKPGEAIPPTLLATNPPQLPAQQPPQQNQPQPMPQAQPQPQPGQVGPEHIVPHIVQMVCHGFDTKNTGEETAVAVCFQFAEHIEALGIDALLRDPTQIALLVEGNPLLKARSAHAKWPQFQAEFMEYMSDRFGVGDDDEVAGPQPVA